ncbi:MAG TPA: hypothetical protein VGB08_00405, partial [Allosphingosinicella sp.]
MRDDDLRDPPATELIERMTSRVVNSLVIAAGVIAVGLYAGGGDGTHVEAPDYQIVSTPDGRVVRLNVETGSIVSCDAARCRLIQMQSDGLEREFEEREEQGQAPQQALPPPAAAPQGAVAPGVPQG